MLRGQLVKCFTTLFPNTLIFFVEKNERSFKASHIFSTKNIRIFQDINIRNFNKMLTNDVVYFEQLVPEVILSTTLIFGKAVYGMNMTGSVVNLFRNCLPYFLGYMTGVAELGHSGIYFLFTSLILPNCLHLKNC